MSFLGVIFIYASILFHELAHALMAKHYGIKVPKIILMLFGGLACFSDLPKNAKEEFVIAIVGPLASSCLTGIFIIKALFLYYIGWTPLAALCVMLFIINALFVINLLPVFPLDGGRCFLRAPLWAILKDLKKATKIAVRFSQLTALALAVSTFIFLNSWWLFSIFLFLVFLAEFELRGVMGNKII